MHQFINQIRFYHYISAVIINQQADPLCSECKAYVNTVSTMREGLAMAKSNHEKEFSSLTSEILHLYNEALSRITSIKTSEDASAQKKAGNCTMPKGVCFIKSSKKLLETL